MGKEGSRDALFDQKLAGALALFGVHTFLSGRSLSSHYTRGSAVWGFGVQWAHA
jgi:hypothetical protein